MTDLNRRGWVLGGVLGVAALGGGAWLRSRRAPVEMGDAAAPPPAGATSGASTAAPLVPIPGPLVALDGRTLTAADVGGRFVVLNFWAPWCPPCVREMPELDRFSRSAAGRDTLVIGLAIDEQPAVEKFVAAHPVGFPVVVLGYAGLAWARRLSNDPNVALPFTAVFDRAQHLAQHKFGATDVAELSRWVQGS